MTQILPIKKNVTYGRLVLVCSKFDGLKPSSYMEELTEKQFRGDYSYEKVYQEISAYHATQDATTVEADLVSLRIAEVLSLARLLF